MDNYFAYIRVSTVKQGERGTSLNEQRGAIEAYAAKHGLNILAWYEEMETAAKQGRRQFARMLSDLQKDHARGVVIHKVDRSARNLKDWAQLADLIDTGADIRFVHENLDLASRGGRLSADIQAVVAADFIRNHRQVVKMGFEGRLKQGLYPLPAPRGYLNQGKGRPKIIDPVTGPLVRQAFELYGSTGYTFETLRVELAGRGLRGRSGKALALDAVSKMLHNPFYVGLIRIQKTSQTWQGVHEPLVTQRLFDRVQAIMSGRVYARPQKYDHTYRRLIRCAACARTLTAEIQKGHTYYRCHGRSCFGTSVREEEVEAAVKTCLAQFAFTDEEFDQVKAGARELLQKADKDKEDTRAALKRDLANCEDRLTRLTDALIDGLLDKTSFEERKALLLQQRTGLREALAAPEKASFADRVLEKFELGRTAYLGYDLANAEEKREIVRELSSNFVVRGKNVEITTRIELQDLGISRPIL